MAALVALLLWLQAVPPALIAYEERANKLFTVQRYQEGFDAVDEALRLDSKLAPALVLKAKLAMAANR